MIVFAAVIIGIAVGVFAGNAPDHKSTSKQDGTSDPAATASGYDLDVGNDLIIGRCYWSGDWLQAYGKLRNTDSTNHDYEVTVRWKFHDPIDPDHSELGNSESTDVSVPARDASAWRVDKSYHTGDLNDIFTDGEDVRCDVEVSW